MIVCVCNRVSDSQIKREVRNGACCLQDLSDRLGVGAQCGCCQKTACRILEEQLESIDLQNLHASIAA